ncbi:hypothetical protein ACTJJJ_29860, partial [Dyadobacter sp. 22481]
MKTIYAYIGHLLFLFFLTPFDSDAQEKGIIETERSSPYGIVSFSESSQLTGISNTRHVDGYVEKSGTTRFTFPVGNKGAYRPFATEADGTIGAYFLGNPSSAYLPDGAPYAITSFESTVKKVSDKEFWDINGTKATKITLTWTAASDIAGITGDSLRLLSIVGWNSTTSKWEKITSVVDEIALLGGASTIQTGSITTVSTIVPNTYRVYTLASLTVATNPAVFQGGFEVASCEAITGWALDKNHADAPVTVELVEGSVVHATATANIFREDLLQYGSTGKYGFRIVPPATLNDGKTRQLSIRIRNSNYMLPGSPLELNCNYESSFESADCAQIKGWIWDKNNPDRALTIEILNGSSVLATTTANILRSDLLSAGKGTGKYGFSVPLPQSLRNGAQHSLTARIKDVNYILPGGPKLLICSPPSNTGSAAVSCETVSGWVWDKNYPNEALTVELVENGIVRASGLANIFRQNLKDGGIGTGNYGFSIPLPASLKDTKQHQLAVRVKNSGYLIPGSGGVTSFSVTCALPVAYAGAFESIDCGTIKGWAWDQNYPNNALTVEVMEGTTVLATVLANAYRADLQSAGTGTGNYGFSIPLPAVLKDTKAHQISIRVKGSTVLLANSPKSVTCALPFLNAGSVAITCETISGWVWDKNYPNEALTVELVENGVVRATGLANIFRQNLKDGGTGTGYYGFSIPMPAALKDTKPHQLSARVKNSGYLIPGAGAATSFSLTCALPVAYAGAFESIDCGTIKGWAWDQNYPNNALTVEVMEGTTVLATVLANAYRADLQSAGTGTGNYGFTIPLPAVLKDTKAHQISIRVKGSTVLLANSPKSVTCALPF